MSTCSCEINPFSSGYVASALSVLQPSNTPWWIKQESYLADEIGVQGTC